MSSGWPWRLHISQHDEPHGDGGLPSQQDGFPPPRLLPAKRHSPSPEQRSHRAGAGLGRAGGHSEEGMLGSLLRGKKEQAAAAPKTAPPSEDAGRGSAAPAKESPESHLIFVVSKFIATFIAILAVPL